MDGGYRATLPDAPSAGEPGAWDIPLLPLTVLPPAGTRLAFDPAELLNPGKVIPLLSRCAEYGKMHVHAGALKFPELPRF